MWPVPKKAHRAKRNCYIQTISNLNGIILHIFYSSLDKSSFLLHDYVMVRSTTYAARLLVNMPHMYYQNTINTFLVTGFTVYNNHMHLFYLFEASEQWTLMYLPFFGRPKKGKFWKFSNQRWIGTPHICQKLLCKLIFW